MTPEDILGSPGKGGGMLRGRWYTVSPRPSQCPLLPSRSIKKTKNFRLPHLPPPPHTHTPSISPPATLWSPVLGATAPLNSLLFFQNLPFYLAFLVPQTATPPIGPRQKGGWLHKLSPFLTLHIPSLILSFTVLQDVTSFPSLL